MKKLGLLFIAVSLIIISCDDNQQVVKKLDGEWEVIEYNQEPVTDSTPFLFSKITFNECKLKDNEYCDGSLTITGPYPLSLPTEYTVTNEGNTIAFKNPLAAIDTSLASEDLLFEIVSLEKKKLVLQIDGAVLDLEKAE